MNHFVDQTLPLFGFGFIGILIMAFVKMNDINQMNENYTFSIAFHKFISREWPSYGLAIVVVFATALTHEEWMRLLKSGKLSIDQTISIIGGYLKLSMIAWGALGQYFIYKRFGKMKTPASTAALDQKKSNDQ
ncbi:MAG: hypothetical protein JNK14_00025 [Chitinophagaceae bacterium]|nr:hypothetical protein [Chitinophagaceae bacterium]